MMGNLEIQTLVLLEIQTTAVLPDVTFPENDVFLPSKIKNTSRWKLVIHAVTGYEYHFLRLSAPQTLIDFSADAQRHLVSVRPRTRTDHSMPRTSGRKIVQYIPVPEPATIPVKGCAKARNCQLKSIC
jgi:hypothetical protein